MRLVLLGAPGCGKGTHSAWMIAEYGIPQISTGDILREAVARGSELGTLAKRYMDSGALVPDDVILGLMRERIAAPDAAKGFILDGFPRTIPQAEGLGKLLSQQGTRLDRVVKIDVPREELVSRLTSRRVCPDCKAVYNVNFRPPRQEGVCDACGGRIVQRADDTEETVLSRLGVYEQQTAPLVSYYQAQKLLAVVDGGRGFEETKVAIKAALGA